MRIGTPQNVENTENRQYKIIAVDDEQGIVDSLSIFLKRTGYQFTGVTDPMEAIERVRNEHFDLMILDFIMTPFHGDQVVEEIRKFNKDLYILLLTGHKDLAPPLETIKRLDIQGYCEKSDKFDQLLLLIESGIKSIKQMNEIKHINDKLTDTYDKLEQAYLDSIQTLRYTVEAKDIYTRGHSDRVSEYSVLIGEKLGLPESDIRTLRIGGLFHDIGKIGVPDSILQKILNLLMMSILKLNNILILVFIFCLMLLFFRIFCLLLNIIMKSLMVLVILVNWLVSKFLFLARIAAVADSFDAMTSRRSYRDSLPLETVISEFERCRGSQFDPELDDLFLDILRNDFDSIKEIMEKYK